MGTLPDTAFTKSAYPNGGNIKGEIAAAASPDGIGVIFRVRFSNLPKGGPFRKWPTWLALPSHWLGRVPC